MKILAFGDMQIGAHDRLDDQTAVLARIAHLGIEQQVGLVLNGGDTFEGGEIKPAHLRVFADFVAELRAHGIPVLTVLGNGRHDRHRSVDGLDIFREIPGVQIASTPDIYQFAGCTVAAMPWVSPAWLQAHFGSAASRDEVNAHVASLLVDRVAPDLLEDCRALAPDLPAVLLTHFSISGASLPTGLPADAMREPVLSLPELEAVGFDAVVASHIHKPQLLTSELGGGPVFFTGSPMAHDFGEAGFEHGVWLLDLEADVARAEFVPIESRPLVTIDSDFTAYGDVPFELDAGDIPDGALVRIRYRVTSDQQRRIDVPMLRAAFLAAGAYSVKIVPDIVRADRARVEGVDESLTTMQALNLYIGAQTLPEDLAEQMRARTTSYLEAAA